MTDVETIIDEQLAICDAATEGPWRALTTGPAGGDHWHVCDDGESIAYIHANDGVDEDTREPDARFIALSRAALPAALRALQRVLRRHAPQTYPVFSKGYDEPVVMRRCVSCRVAYPCPTVMDVTQELVA